MVSTLVLKIPLLRKLVRNIITARFTRTLSILITSGVLLVEALEMVQKIIGNVVVAEKFENVLTEVKKGKGLTYTLSNMKFFPALLISMIKVGEESGGLEFSLGKSADYFDQEVDSTIGQLLTVLEPLIIVVLGFVVGFIVLSVLMPMMSIYENAGSGF
jgi:type IV pilus assembly protein PilC